MDLEKNKKAILEIIIITILLIFALLNIETIFNVVAYIVKIFMPFIIGAVLAFVLNVLLNLIENKLSELSCWFLSSPQIGCFSPPFEWLLWPPLTNSLWINS